jgi:hypothetical protein
VLDVVNLTLLIVNQAFIKGNVLSYEIFLHLLLFLMDGSIVALLLKQAVIVKNDEKSTSNGISQYLSTFTIEKIVDVLFISSLICQVISYQAWTDGPRPIIKTQNQGQFESYEWLSSNISVVVNDVTEMCYAVI